MTERTSDSYISTKSSIRGSSPLMSKSILQQTSESQTFHLRSYEPKLQLNLPRSSQLGRTLSKTARPVHQCPTSCPTSPYQNPAPGYNSFRVTFCLCLLSSCSRHNMLNSSIVNLQTLARVLNVWKKKERKRKKREEILFISNDQEDCARPLCVPKNAQNSLAKDISILIVQTLSQ